MRFGRRGKRVGLRAASGDGRKLASRRWSEGENRRTVSVFSARVFECSCCAVIVGCSCERLSCFFHLVHGQTAEHHHSPYAFCPHKTLRNSLSRNSSAVHFDPPGPWQSSPETRSSVTSQKKKNRALCKREPQHRLPTPSNAVQCDAALRIPIHTRCWNMSRTVCRCQAE